MRCDQCGRWMKSAELWRLANDPNAPTSRSMRQMCWDCRLHADYSGHAAQATTTGQKDGQQSAILEEALAIVSAYEAMLDADPSFDPGEASW
ncbi:MAG TPA: hypothetical protein VKQ36_03510 [Ktedonobacterales bacterium]|nr:hypothetical protein [Ktedonobacterales bacterium]